MNTNLPRGLRVLAVAGLVLLGSTWAQQGGEGRAGRAGAERADPDWRDKAMKLRGEAVAPEHFLKDSAALRAWLEKLRAENPEMVERLLRLREENPERFRDEVREIALRRNKGGGGDDAAVAANPDEAKCKELSRQYADTKDPVEKDRIRAELREAVLRSFDLRLQERAERLERMKQELERLQKQLAERKASRDPICEARVDELTRESGLRWEW